MNFCYYFCCFILLFYFNLIFVCFLLYYCCSPKKKGAFRLELLDENNFLKKDNAACYVKPEHISTQLFSYGFTLFIRDSSFFFLKWYIIVVENWNFLQFGEKTSFHIFLPRLKAMPLHYAKFRVYSLNNLYTMT